MGENNVNVITTVVIQSAHTGPKAIRRSCLQMPSLVVAAILDSVYGGAARVLDPACGQHRIAKLDQKTMQTPLSNVARRVRAR